jgi:hypothetical protein
MNAMRVKLAAVAVTVSALLLGCGPGSPARCWLFPSRRACQENGASTEGPEPLSVLPT